jgi:uncharacterized protein with PIN domain
MIVVDASAVVAALIDNNEGGELARTPQSESASLHAPESLDLVLVADLGAAPEPHPIRRILRRFGESSDLHAGHGGSCERQLSGLRCSVEHLRD